MNIGPNIRRIRESRNLNINQCAKRINANWQVWQGWEQGRGPSVGSLERIAKALGCEVADLFTTEP